MSNPEDASTRDSAIQRQVEEDTKQAVQWMRTDVVPVLAQAAVSCRSQGVNVQIICAFDDTPILMHLDLE